jgi:hypothetical protein
MIRVQTTLLPAALVSNVCWREISGRHGVQKIPSGVGVRWFDGQGTLKATARELCGRGIAPELGSLVVIRNCVTSRARWRPSSVARPPQLHTRHLSGARCVSYLHLRHRRCRPPQSAFSGHARRLQLNRALQAVRGAPSLVVTGGQTVRPEHRKRLRLACSAARPPREKPMSTIRWGSARGG